MTTTPTLTSYDASSKAEKLLTVHLTGLEPVAVGTNRFLPDQVVIRYYQFNFDPWTAGSPRLEGARLKADGTPGKARSSMCLLGEQQPPWLVDLIAEHMPTVVAR